MTSDGDILLYATAYCRRYGAGAHLIAQEYAAALKAAGDREGCDTWMRVAAFALSLEQGIPVATEPAAGRIRSA